MDSNAKLLTVRNYRIKIQHLLVIGILVLAFSISFLIRAQPLGYGNELNEFDPFFNYRATKHIVDNGLDSYLQWNDSLSWYPMGRDVSSTSQVMLHVTAAATYLAFGGNSSLYDFTILFPAVIGSLTTIVVFALVRVIGGTTAGLFSALLYSISLPIIIRGSAGWFKSEPLGLFFGILSVYFLLSGLLSKNKKISLVKLVAAGIVLPFSLSSWGGSQFFIIIIGLFIFTLPFLRSDRKFLLWAIPIFTAVTMATSLSFERLAATFVSSVTIFVLIIPTIFLVSCIIVQNKSKDSTKIRNGLGILLIFVVLSVATLLVNSYGEFLHMPSFRYLNAVNPFLITSDPLVDSVSEHATTTIVQSFTFHSVLMIFAGIGIWIILNKTKLGEQMPIQKDMLSFSLILGLFGIYISSAFLRLEVFASLAIIVLSSLGISILARNMFANNSFSIIPKIGFVVGIIILLVIPLVFPQDTNIIALSNSPPTILNGGTRYAVATDDWKDAMEWIKTNTPEDAVIAAWWDYGYWISTLGERATLADNSTTHTSRIQDIATALLSSPDDGVSMLKDMGADYVLVFVAAQKLAVENEQSLYILDGGGDESKKQWFMRISGLPLQEFLHLDGMSGTAKFWDDTLLGKMFPFTPLLYADFTNNLQSPDYKPGRVPIYVKDIKYPQDGDGPLTLVYASNSFVSEQDGPIIGVFIYKINENYTIPQN